MQPVTASLDPETEWCGGDGASMLSHQQSINQFPSFGVCVFQFQVLFIVARVDHGKCLCSSGKNTEANLSLCLKCCWDWTFCICLNMTCVLQCNQSILCLALASWTFMPYAYAKIDKFQRLKCSLTKFEYSTVHCLCESQFSINSQLHIVTTCQGIIGLFNSIDISPFQVNFGLNCTGQVKLSIVKPRFSPRSFMLQVSILGEANFPL